MDALRKLLEAGKHNLQGNVQRVLGALIPPKTQPSRLPSSLEAGINQAAGFRAPGSAQRQPTGDIVRLPGLLDLPARVKGLNFLRPAYLPPAQYQPRLDNQLRPDLMEGDDRYLDLGNKFNTEIIYRQRHGRFKT